MNCNQSIAWRSLALTLVLASLLGLLVFGVLRALPTAAANEFPNRGNGGSSPTLSSDTSVFTVTGAVDDRAGMPVGDVEVFAFSGAASNKTFTNSSGQYTLTLSTGIYYDFAFHPPVEVHLASQLRRGIRETQVLNVTLPPGHIISGTVYSDLTKTNPVSNVNVFASNPNTFVGLGGHPTGPTGAYQLALEEGNWELTFTPPHFLGFGPTRTAEISLTHDIIQDIILQPGFSITGTVTATDSGEAVANVDIFAEDPDAPPGLEGFGMTATDANGLYTGTLSAGDFDILFFAPPFQGLGATVVTNVVGPPDKHLDVALPTGYTVSGTVKCGQGVANTFVHAAPEPPLSSGRLSGWGRFSGADGYYALALQPGAYTVTVDPPGGGLPTRIVTAIIVTQDLTLDFDYNCIFLPIIPKC
ncbi:MAG: carboxypeptidase-like regulatory domain-containing protein [Anaerolineae bacterium]